MTAAATHLTPADLGLSDADHLGATATLLQISSGFCAPCRAARHILEHAATGSSGVTHVDVDVAHNTALAEKLAITQTPTVLVLDATGAIRTRYEGVPRLAEVRAELERLTPRSRAR